MREIANADTLLFFNTEIFPTFDLRGDLERIDAPTLVLVGAEDALTGTAQARSVAAAVPGARLEVVEGSGHSPQVERPAEFVRLVVPFLKR
jgi:pimeloyl-ACP methyl ester carboxylesterase